MAVVVSPGCEIGVGVGVDVPSSVAVQSACEPTRCTAQMGCERSLNVLVDVGSRREINWIAANVLVARVLVHTDVVDLHRRRECQVFKIHGAEVTRHSQVHDEILQGQLVNSSLR